METTKFTAGVNSLSAAIATEIENDVTYYTFYSEAETETAVIECIEKGVKFVTTGRRSIAIRQSETPTNTETAMNTTDTTDNVTTAYEETHAARCLHIYLNNTSEIYSRFTVPAIEYAAGLAAFGREQVAEWMQNGAKVRGVEIVEDALKAAARLVRKHDHITPTPADIEAVKADYVAYIIECAQYEVNNA